MELNKQTPAHLAIVRIRVLEEADSHDVASFALGAGVNGNGASCRDSRNERAVSNSDATYSS